MKKALLKHIFIIVLIILFSSSIVCAVTVKQWTEKGAGDAGGYYEGVAISDRGKMVAGFKAGKKVYKENYTFWTGEFDFDGTPIFGGGSPARIVKLLPSGFSDYAFESSLQKVLGLERQSVTVLRKIPKPAMILSGYSGSGVIGVIRPGDKEITKLCKLPSENTYAIVDSGDGFAYAATGPLGQVFRINLASLVAEPWAQMKDTNIISLHKSKAGRILAGGGETGNLYEIKGKGQVETLHNFPGEVVRRIVAYKDGFLVATSKLRQIPEEKGEEAYKKYYKKLTDLESGFGSDFRLGGAPDQMRSQLANSTGGSLYFMGKDYRIDRIVSLKEEYILDLQVAASGLIYLATGPKGKVYMLKELAPENLELWTVYGFDYTHVNAIVLKEGQPLYFLASGNEAVVFERDKQVARGGFYRTRVFNTGAPSKFGHLYWGGRNLTVYSRHGNTPKPDKTWTAWIERKTGGPEEIKKSVWNFVQLKFEVKGDSVFDGFSYYYLEKNQRPVITGLLVSERDSGKPGVPRQLSWEMSDPNGDRLAATVWLKEESGHNWINLSGEQPLTTGKFSLNTTSVPDGRYVLKVAVSDEASNYTGALTTAAVSPAFSISNSRPEFSELKYDKEKGMVTGKVLDRISIVTDLAFSMDGGEWTGFPAADGVTDEKSEELSLVIPDKLKKGYHTFYLRAVNEVGNEGVARLNIDYDGVSKAVVMEEAAGED